MNRLIIARKGRVLSVTDKTVVISYSDLLRPGTGTHVLSLGRSAIQGQIAVNDTVVWDLSVNGGLHVIKRLVEREASSMPILETRLPTYLRMLTEEAPTVEPRYSSLARVESDGSLTPSCAGLTLFVRDMVDLVSSFGCDIEQGLAVTTFLLMSCEGGVTSYCYNYGRVIVTPSAVKGRGWYRTRGDTFFGDSETVCMVAFNSPEDSMDYLLNTYTPRPKDEKVARAWPSTPLTDGDYRAAGACFWRIRGNDPTKWFAKALLAGLLGERAKIDKDGYGTALQKMYDRAHEYVRRLHTEPFVSVKHVQSGLSLIRHLDPASVEVPYYSGAIDGSLDVETRESIMAFQRAVGMKETGVPDRSFGLTLLHMLSSLY